MLIIQGTKEGRTKEQGLFRLVPTLTGAFWSYNDPDTPGQLHQETVKADMTVLLPGARQKKAPCFKFIRKKEISLMSYCVLITLLLFSQDLALAQLYNI